MNELSVGKCIDILNVFYVQKNQDLWTNKIVTKVNETTGSKDSPAIKKAIHLLEKGLIVESKKINKQKKIFTLTTLGKEIIDLMENFHNFNYKFSKMQQLITQYEELTTTDQEIRKNKLLALKWKKEDIESFNDIMNVFHQSLELYINNIFNLLSYRFISIISNYKVNSISQKILKTIFIDEISKQFDSISKIKSVNITKDDSYGIDLDEQIIVHTSHSPANLVLTFFYQLEKIYAYNYLANNNNIQNESDNLIKSMISTLNLNKNILEFKRNRLELLKFSRIENQGSNTKKVYKDNALKLANIYNGLINVKK